VTLIGSTLDLPMTGRFIKGGTSILETVPMTATTLRTLDIPVLGMTCASCVGRVEKAIRAAPGVKSATVNLAAERARVEMDDAGSAAGVTQAIRSAGYEPIEHTIELKITGMTCASCVGRVERALQATPGVLDASVNLATERATVRVLEGVADTRALTEAVAKAGYAAEAASAPDATSEDREQASRAVEIRSLGRAVAVAGAATLPLFVIEMGLHFVPGAHGWLMDSIGMTSWRIISFLLATFVLFVPGLRFYRKGVPNLVRLTPDMNSLVVLGATAAWVLSV